MPLRNIPQAKSWMKRTGSWFSDVWAYLSNIQSLITDIGSGLVPKATRLVIYTIKMTVADRQYSQRLPDHTKGFTIQTTDGTSFRLSSEANRVAGANRPYWSVATNSSFDETELDLEGVTLYFASSTADKTIEIFVKV